MMEGNNTYARLNASGFYLEPIDRAVSPLEEADFLMAREAHPAPLRENNEAQRPEEIKRTESHSSTTTNNYIRPVIQQDPVNEPLLHTTKTPIPWGWPTSPKPIKTFIGAAIWNTIVDVILFACSVAFLAFGFIVNSYDGTSIKKQPQTADRLLYATGWGPTVFPILFAAVLGRATHSILLWRFERGERIGVLDVLAGSISLTSTVTSQVQLRIIRPFGLAMIAIWMLSPVGGQASFRQMTVKSKISSQPAGFTYMVPGGNILPMGSLYHGANQVNTIFLSAMISRASMEGAVLDAWGNVKVPRIEHYENSSIADGEGWYLTRNGNRDTYSSIIGVPMYGINSSDFIDYNLNIETMYLNLDCSLLSASEYDFEILRTAYNVSGEGAIIWWTDNTTHRATMAPDDLKPFVFPYSLNEYDAVKGLIQCAMETSYVEVNIACPTSLTCAASKIRRSRMPHPPPAYTQLDLGLMLPEEYGSTWEVLAKSYITSCSNYALSTTPPNEVFLLTSENPTTSKIVKPSEPVSAHAIATRLGQLLNAYWTWIHGRISIPGGLSDQTSYVNNTISWPYQDTYVRERSGFFSRTWPAEGSKSTKTNIIVAHIGWNIALCIAASVLIIASLLPPFIRYFFTRGPDLMMNISSLATRNNPYILLPANGSFLNASDRSRFLQNTRVRFGDIDGTAEYGSLAISSMANATDVTRIRKGRSYQ